MLEIDGIVIGVSKYKDFDSVINILTKDSVVAVLGRGSFRNDSKTNKFLSLFLFGKFDLYRGGVGSYKLRDCKINYEYRKLLKNDDEYLIFDLLSEIIFKFTIENNDVGGYFELLSKVLNSFKNKDNWYAITLYFIAQILVLNGFGFNFDRCLECGETNVTGFDFATGCSVCSEHYTPTTLGLDNKTFSFYKNLFYGDFNEISSYIIDRDIFIDCIVNFNTFILSNLNIKLISVSLF